RRMERGERDVLVRSDVAGDHRTVRRADEGAHDVHCRRRRGIATRRDARQIAVVRQHERSPLLSTGPRRSHARRAGSTPYTFDASMKLLSVLTCWRGVATPVPGAAGVREKAIAPRSSVNASSGSFVLKAMGALSPGCSFRRPMS